MFFLTDKWYRNMDPKQKTMVQNNDDRNEYNGKGREGYMFR